MIIIIIIFKQIKIIIIFKQKLCGNEYSLFLLGISETWHGLFLYQKDIVSEIKPRKTGWKRPRINVLWKF